MNFQPNEVANLTFGILAAIVLVAFTRSIKTFARFRLFFLCYAALLGSWFCTVIEGILWYDLFNFLEHFGLAAAGMLFAVAVWSENRRPPEKTQL